MAYTLLCIESTKSHTQALCTGQSLLNTSLQSKLQYFLGLAIKQHSLSTFTGDLGLKKEKVDSTETITMKRHKKFTIIL